MQRRNWIPALTLLLVAQVALAGVLGLTGGDSGVFHSEDPLVAFDSSAVDEIRIREGESQVLLRRQDGAWRLPENHDFAADADAVDRLLMRLGKIEKGWPVAKTAGAAQRFKVGDDEFERRITLASAGTTVADLLLGSSPGLRKVHAREASSDEIHAVEFAAHEASAKTNDWIDHELLQRKSADLARVDIDGVELERSGEDWLLPGLEDDHETVVSESRPLVEQATQLRVESVLGTEPDPAYRQDTPELRIVLHPNQGEPVTYTVSKPEGASHYVVKSSDGPYYLKVPGYLISPLTQVDRNKLFQARISTEPAPDEAADAQGTAEPEG